MFVNKIWKWKKWLNNKLSKGQELVKTHQICAKKDIVFLDLAVVYRMADMNLDVCMYLISSLIFNIAKTWGVRDPNVTAIAKCKAATRNVIFSIIV